MHITGTVITVVIIAAMVVMVVKVMVMMMMMVVMTLWWFGDGGSGKGGSNHYIYCNVSNLSPLQHNHNSIDEISTSIAWIIISSEQCINSLFKFQIIRIDYLVIQLICQPRVCLYIINRVNSWFKLLLLYLFYSNLNYQLCFCLMNSISQGLWWWSRQWR